MVSTLDEKMLSLNEAIQECLEKQEELKYQYKQKRATEQDQRVLQEILRYMHRRHCRRQCL